MNELSLERVNANAPYEVVRREGRYVHLFFCNDYGVDYEISFRPDDSIVTSGAFALDITRRTQKESPGDPKFRLTLVAIIEEFFWQNNDVMLYLTETGDGRQAMRNMLFIQWFNTYEHRDRYVIRAAEGRMEGQLNFMALFSRTDNPRLQQALDEFEETVSLLFDPPVGSQV